MGKSKKEINKFFDLSGEAAIVTGGQGLLGGQYAKTLALAGARVAVIDIAENDSNFLAQCKKDGLDISSYQSDITDFDSVGGVFNKISKKIGIPTILVNNAGIGTIPNASSSENGPFEEYPLKSWDAIINSHLKGMFTVSKIFVKMIKSSSKSGSIINVSSTYGIVAPDQSMYEFRRKQGENYYKPIAYTVAKSGVIGFTRWLAEYCAPQIRVNTLVPGGVKTKHLNTEFVEEYNRRTILKRMANPDDYNGAILFLASKASSYMTGAELIIDGGWTAK